MRVDGLGSNLALRKKKQNEAGKKIKIKTLEHNNLNNDR
jgi:hypothetical protein